MNHSVMLIAGLHLVHDAWSVTVLQVPHYRKNYLYFIAHYMHFAFHKRTTSQNTRS